LIARKPAQASTGVGDCCGNRLIHFVRQGGSQLPHTAHPVGAYEIRMGLTQRLLSLPAFAVAAVSLAWVHSRHRVTSTIIGARTMQQLDSNLAALDLPLSTDHINRLDKLSEPKLNFPAQYLKIAPSFSNAVATVNGIESTLMPFAPKDLEDHY
jgi:hypothetical protein